MGDRSAIFVQRGVPAHKQTTACLDYASEHHLPMVAVIPYWASADAVQMVRNGEISTVITAFDSRVAQRLATDIDGIGRVVYVHPVAGVVHPRRPAPRITELVTRWRAQGRTCSEIAADIGRDTEDVRAIIRRARDPLD